MKTNIFGLILFVSLNSFAGDASESFDVNSSLLNSMIKSGRIGDCHVQIQNSGESGFKLSIAKRAPFVLSNDGKLVQNGINSAKNDIDVNLAKSFGTNVFGLADATGTIQLNGGSTVIFFDTNTRLAYRLIDFSARDTQGEIECAEYVRPKNKTSSEQ